MLWNKTKSLKTNQINLNNLIMIYIIIIIIILLEVGIKYLNKRFKDNQKILKAYFIWAIFCLWFVWYSINFGVNNIMFIIILFFF
jgi:hypothetical protein